jgi:hypothetical protein
MPIQFDQQNSLVSAEQISEFESAQGLTLPEDYKQFLLETNGGELKPGMLVDYIKERVKLRPQLQNFLGSGFWVHHCPERICKV